MADDPGIVDDEFDIISSSSSSGEDTPLAGGDTNAEWRVSSNGREYIPAPDRQGVVWRRDGETVPDALERDATTPRGAPRQRKSRKRDPSPAGAAARKIAVEGPTDAALAGSLGQLLALPTVPALVVWHCEYCANHFAKQADPTARQLVELSHRSPGLRQLILRVHKVVDEATVGAVIAMYIGKPLLHHLAPDPMLDLAGPLLGVPSRHNGHIPTAPPFGTEGPTSAEDAERPDPPPQTFTDSPFWER